MRTKILLLSTTLFYFASTSSAQINKGTHLLGGSFSMHNENNNQNIPDSKVRSLNINIQFGIASKENTVIGLIGSYGFTHNYYPPNPVNTSKSDLYTAGVFYRKYKKLANKFYLFGEADAVYGHSKNTAIYSQTETKSTSNGALISAVPGASYAIAKKIQVELLMPNIISLSYQHVKTDIKNPATPVSIEKGNIFSLNTNLNSNLLSSFGIGFKFLL